MRNSIITIDGPSGSGKTTVSRLLAERLGFFHLKGGTCLRSFTYFVIKNKVDPTNESELSNLLTKFNLTINEIPGSIDYHILINDIEVENFLWTPEVDSIVSTVSSFACVRNSRRVWLRKIGQNRKIVADGRTLGSEIFPDADLKIFLYADLESRASRRFIQYKNNNINMSIEQIKNSISVRDETDKHGVLNRTIQYDDQVFIDSSKMDQESVVKLIEEKYRKINYA